MAKPKKFGSIFSGGGGFDTGMVAAGWDPVFGIDMDPVAANVYRMNIGGHLIEENVLKLDPTQLLQHGLIGEVDLLHLSPPCPRFSTANSASGETQFDINMAKKGCEFIALLRPRIVTIGNVLEYRNSHSLDGILKLLYVYGYQVGVFNVNLADYGVPQTRKRMFLIARLDKTPVLPWPTHEEDPRPGLFSTATPWVGWYEAIADMVDQLPDDKFAEWQLKLLPNDFRTILAPGANATSFPYRHANEPSFVIADTKKSNANRAFIETQNTARDATICLEHQPATTVTVSGMTRPSHQRIIDRGRTVRLISRALARLQGFPDSYVFPQCSSAQAKKKMAKYKVNGVRPDPIVGSFAIEHINIDDTAAALVIGNAVPPLFAQRLGEKFMGE